MRTLFYLPDRVIGGPAPPASHLVSAEWLAALRNDGLDVVAYAKGCRINVPFYEQRGPVAPGDLPGAIDLIQPDLVWSWIAWESHEIAPQLQEVHRRKVAYVQSMTHLPLELTSDMRSASFLCESRLTWELCQGFDRYLLKMFVPRREVYNGALSQSETHNYLFMHRLEKGLDCAIETCAAIRGIQKLYVTADRGETEETYGRPLPPFVHCVGLQSGTTKVELMARCDAAFYCSPEPEATGFSPAESMLSGLPLLAVPRSEYGRRISIFEYIEEGGIPSVIANSATDLAAMVNAGALAAIDRCMVRDRARAFFDNQTSLREHVAALHQARQWQTTFMP